MAADFGRDDGSTFHINLAPMLDIIVSIIPMLLLSVVFVQMAAIDTPVAASGQKGASPTATKKLQLLVGANHSLELTLAGGGTATVPAKAGVFDWEGLAVEIQKTKDKHPDVTRLELMPDKQVSIQSVVEVMDHVQGSGIGKYEAVGFGNLTGDAK